MGSSALDWRFRRAARSSVPRPPHRTAPAASRTSTRLGLTVGGGYDAARAVVEAVTLMTPAVSLGSVDTRVQHPAGLAHRVLSDDAREAGGITPGLPRLSVGLESAGDLWTDVAAALAVAEHAGAAEPAGVAAA